MDLPSRGAGSSSERCLTNGDALLPKVRFTVDAARHPQWIPRFLVLVNRTSETRGLHRHPSLLRRRRELDRNCPRGARDPKGC